MSEFMREIYELLQDESSDKYNPMKDCECFALTTKFKKKGKSNKTFLFYFVLMLTHFAILVRVIYPAVKKMSLYINVSYGLFGLCLLFNYFLSVKNPGFIEKKIMRKSVTETAVVDDDFLQLLKVYDAATLCFECELLRTPRSRHCF